MYLTVNIILFTEYSHTCNYCSGGGGGSVNISQWFTCLMYMNTFVNIQLTNICNCINTNSVYFLARLLHTLYSFFIYKRLICFDKKIVLRLYIHVHALNTSLYWLGKLLTWTNKSSDIRHFVSRSVRCQIDSSFTVHSLSLFFSFLRTIYQVWESGFDLLYCYFPQY